MGQKQERKMLLQGDIIGGIAHVQRVTVHVYEVKQRLCPQFWLPVIILPSSACSPVAVLMYSLLGASTAMVYLLNPCEAFMFLLFTNIVVFENYTAIPVYIIVGNRDVYFIPIINSQHIINVILLY